MDNTELKGVIEGLLFLWGDPLSVGDIAKIIEQPLKETRALLTALAEDYDCSGRGLVLRRYEDSYQLSTRKAHMPYFSKLIDSKKASKLTNSSMETLAIIAYKQPITRIEIDNIRGVKSNSSVDTLLHRGLIEEAGRLDQIGKPIIYRTTTKFLQLFELNALSELLDIESIEALFEREAQREDQ